MFGHHPATERLVAVFMRSRERFFRQTNIKPTFEPGSSMPVLSVTAAGLLLFDFQTRMWGVRSRCGISRFKATNNYYASGEQINAPFTR